MVTHILVPVDGSEHSRRAGRFAGELAKQTGARVTLLIVIRPPTAVPLPPFDGFSMTGPSPDPEHLAAARAIFDEVEGMLPKDQAHAQVALGSNVAETICEEARVRGADLVVIGARGMGAAERWIMGSVSDQVVRDSPAPVTVVH